MKLSGMKSTLLPTSLRKSRSANSFALRWMEEEQRRAVGRRLWELRENSPHTNRSIADAIGVTERTVAEWIAGRQGITYDHATAVAALFDVNLNWFWHGPEQSPAPDVLSELSAAVGKLQREVRDLAAQQTKLLAGLAKAEGSKAASRSTSKRPARSQADRK